MFFVCQESPESSSKMETKSDVLSDAKAISDALEFTKADACKKGDNDAAKKAVDADATKTVSAPAPAKVIGICHTTPRLC